MTWYMTMLWVSPLQLAIATGLAYREVGWSALGGAATLVFILFYTCKYSTFKFSLGCMIKLRIMNSFQPWSTAS